MKNAQRRKAIADLNITNLVDVILTLLIIFMITAPMMTQSHSVRVDLPQAKTSTAIVKENAVVLGIGKNGEFFFDDKPCDAAGLADALAARLAVAKDSVVIISGHRSAPYASVVFAYDVMQALGIKRFSHEVR
jgi:biopolymer transport protein ExbD